VYTPKRGIPIILKGSGKPLTEEEFLGAVGWKQGFCYKYIYPPYGQNDIINSLTPIQGIPIKKGARSAFESIIRTHKGFLPPTITRDMGIMDITISGGDKRDSKPKISFKVDKKQKTKSTGTGFSASLSKLG
jgi:hypothetical protein